MTYTKTRKELVSGRRGYSVILLLTLLGAFTQSASAMNIALAINGVIWGAVIIAATLDIRGFDRGTESHAVHVRQPEGGKHDRVTTEGHPQT